jgi:hypothetical protein
MIVVTFCRFLFFYYYFLLKIKITKITIIYEAICLSHHISSFCFFATRCAKTKVVYSSNEEIEIKYLSKYILSRIV